MHQTTYRSFIDRFGYTRGRSSKPQDAIPSQPRGAGCSTRCPSARKTLGGGGELFEVVEKEWELARLRLTSGNARMKEVLVSGMIDKETGKISKVFSNFTKKEIDLGKHLDFINELHPTLKKRLTEHIKRAGKNGSGLNLDDPDVYKFAWKSMDNAHAEFRALDDILKQIDPKGTLGEEAINRIMGYNSFLFKPGIQHTCADCFYLTYGVTYIK